MPPARLGDGTEVSPAEIAEARMGDGTVLFQADAIPDSEDVHIQYVAEDIPASDGDSISTWADASGSGFDLSGGAPEYRADALNGSPTIRFDGTDDVLDVGFSAMSQPYTVAHVARIVGDSSNAHYIHGSEQGSGTFSFSRWGPGTGDVESFDYFAGSQILHETAFISDFAIHLIVVDSANTVYRLNNDEQTGDPGTNDLDGYSLGARYDGLYGNVDITESVVWQTGMDSTQRDDVVQYFNEKYSVF